MLISLRSSSSNWQSQMETLPRLLSHAAGMTEWAKASSLTSLGTRYKRSSQMKNKKLKPHERGLLQSIDGIAWIGLFVLALMIAVGHG